MNIFLRNKKRNNSASSKEIRVRFLNGILQPLDAVDLREGEEVRVTIAERSKGKGLLQALRISAGGWKNLIDGEKLKNNIYQDRLLTTRAEPKL